MALTIADRVRETTTTTGTGTVTLAAAVTGYRRFLSVVATDDQCNYVISLGAEWEVGVGTMASTTTLARTTVLASSNAGALVNFSAGIKDVFLTHPAALMESMLLKDRNLLHNGAMKVSQRVTAGVIVSNITTFGFYTADRWYSQINALGTWQQTCSATSPPAGTGIGQSLLMACTTTDTGANNPAAGDYALITQSIEGQFLQHLLKGTVSAKPLTLSFWVKSNKTGTYIAELYDSNNARFVSAAYTISVSATWEYKTITFPADTTGAFVNDSTASLMLIFWLACGTTFDSGTLGTTWHTSTGTNRAKGQVNLADLNTNTWQITGVQLEVGSIPTPFEHRRFNDELITCMRYYEKSYNYADIPSSGGPVNGYIYEKCYASNTTNIDPGPYVYYKVRKRATPATISYWRPDGTAGSWLWNGVGAAPITYVANERGFSTYCTTLSGLTAAAWYTVTGHWSASADI